ncbi:hypothetical protein CDAR_304951 [Caerostris darwini]|uniref:Uncharacterized protein n=1 Tax=Caerostris darwini TaxID=1538125 RepID=A0AAV4Q8H8_9ARAC|nr:hypothetical protein CDAR_304951 [Caerostris darwini]
MDEKIGSLIDGQNRRSDANGGAKARMINRPFTEEEKPDYLSNMPLVLCMDQKLALGSRFHDRRSKTRSDANGGAKARMINRSFTEKGKPDYLSNIPLVLCMDQKLALGSRFHDRRSKTRSDANGGAKAIMINRPFTEKGKPDYLSNMSLVVYMDQKLAGGNRFHDRRPKTRSDANGGAKARMMNRPFTGNLKPDYLSNMSLGMCDTFHSSRHYTVIYAA